MIPARYARLLFGFFLSGLMSFLVSGITVVRSYGLSEALPAIWASAWLTSWAIAFPTVLVVAPVAQRLVNAITDSAD